MVSFLFFVILLLTLDQANANTSPNELFSTTTVTENDLPSVLTGMVNFDGVPVEGADVNLLQNETIVYTTMTTLGAGTVPSFTVTLSDPPINAIVSTNC